MWTELVRSHREFFATGKTLDLTYRKRQLNLLYALIEEFTPALNAAMKADFGKSSAEVYTTELALVLEDIRYTSSNLQKLTAKRYVKTNWLNFPAKSYIVTEPFGVCLIISPWNYPILLALNPLVSAIAAGNTVILKPSELTPATSEVLAKLCSRLDKGLVSVVQGGAEETQALLQERFDKLFFTGSTAVGKLVYQAAAKHLTPVTLELGGKSPAIVTETAAIHRAAQRLVWAKFLNAGQTCIAPDYAIVHEQLAHSFKAALIAELKKQQHDLAHGNYVRIINERHFARLEKLLQQSKVLYGGEMNSEERVISPSLLDQVNWDDAVMQEELFGPLLPILTYSNFTSLMQHLATLEKPLAAYLFSTKSTDIKLFETHFSFGNGAINEAVMQITNVNLPFGGVGTSGIGAYHGAYGIRAFSHEKSIMKKPNWFELPIKYGKTTPLKQRLIRWIGKL